jgi:hypothetical protein
MTVQQLISDIRTMRRHDEFYNAQPLLSPAPVFTRESLIDPPAHNDIKSHGLLLLPVNITELSMSLAPGP